MCFFIKFGRHVSHSERMDPIDFGGQRSKVKVTIDMYGNKLVNTIKTKLFFCFFSELGGHVNHCERINPIDFGGHRSKFKVTMDK